MPLESSTPVLFLSGAGLPAWIWDAVRAELPVSSVVAEHPRGGRASLREYAEAALAQAPEGSFVLVAHSAGGAVAGEIVAAAPDRVAGVLGVAASIPVPGGSFVSALPVPQRYVIGPIMRIAGTRPPEKAIRAGLGSGLGEDDLTRLVADFTPESQRLYRDRLSPHAFPERAGYVVTTADREFAPALQRRYAARLTPAAPRELATGHLPMLEDPKALTRVVTEFLASA
ncbi:alpha/beta fold hydrolase [Nocardia sp. NPDC057668]|uniref:alpha/beta fold hydrolase n=1 Tax=Nocardia sp. NPDC057668 TaxID=3346202 RepID=UPI00366DAB22